MIPVSNGNTSSMVINGRATVTKGLGLTNPQLLEGVSGPSNVAASIKVVVAGKSASLLGAVASPQFPGLFQVAFTVPSDSVTDGTGQIPVQLQVNDTTLLFSISLQDEGPATELYYPHGRRGVAIGSRFWTSRNALRLA